MHERAIPVKVFEALIRETMKWVEVNRPIGSDREHTAQWVLSAAFSMVVTAGAACASIGALGGEIDEEEFMALAREAFRRAQPGMTQQAGATA